ncbi:MAG: DNA cytosine methyltransferase [Phascolarctobacterium sp.]|nr:DNA cytosine methyltransferase [Phascolarctobacterium sp.]
MAFAQNQRDEVRDLGEKAGALQAEPGMKQQTFIAESAIGCDQYNGDLCGEKASTLGVNCGISTVRNGILVPTTFEPGILKREGGHIYEGVSGTLRANAGDNQLSVAYGVTCKGNGDAFVSKETHTSLSTGGGQAGQGYPCVVYPDGDVSGYDGYNQCLTGEVSKTITSGRNDTHNIPCVVHPNQNACGVDFYNQSLTGDVAKSITSAATDADHVLCVLMDAYGESSYKVSNVSSTLMATQNNSCMRNTPLVCMATQQGGAEIRQDDKAPCLTASAGMSGNNQSVIAYSFDSLNSNSMKSSNPLSGCRQVDVAKCLDTTIPEPSKNQGGMAIVEQKVINLNKDDFQSKQILDPQGIAPAIYAGECRRGGGECYIVDKMTGGNQEPGVVCVYNGENITSPLNKTNPQADDPCHTLGTDSRNYLVYCLQGNGIDRADTAGCNGKGWKEDFSYTLNTIDRPAVCYAVENHPADSRVNLDESGTCQCLTGRMGTGGGNVPMVLSVDMGGGKSSCVINENVSPTLTCTHYGEPAIAYETRKTETYQRTVGTLCACDYKGINNEYVADGKCIVESVQNNASMANGKDIVGTLSASQGQKLWLGNQEAFSGEFHVLEKVPCDGKENTSPVYCVGNGQVDQAYLQEKVGALNCMHEQQAVVLDRAFYNQGANAKFEPQLYTDGTVPPLMARGPAAVSVRYVVRRLTPTECARLQGFPDGWMYPIVKEDFTDEEYKFWLDVRNTYAAINDKQVKDYTKDAMVKWYNKLFTDSSAYKMWGNGIALPNAMYVMQGITDLVKDSN